MISMREFAKNVVALSKTITEYVWGETGENGKCDCVGLVIGALRMGGVKWTGTNGTNYTARNEMRWLSPLESGDKLRTGMVVLKSRAPGQSGYDLPEKYKQGADLNDYYHIGVVTGEEPLEITHCTSPGPIKVDRSADAWNWYGELKLVDAQETGETQSAAWRTMYVTGGKLALRNGPGKSYQLKVWIPDGAQVQAQDAENGWVRVQYGKYDGYSMAAFLRDEPEAASDSVTVTLDRNTAEAMMRALEEGMRNGA